MPYLDTKQLLSDAKFYESYSRYDESLGRYETWGEAVDRVMMMHRKFYASKMTPELDSLITTATNAYKDKKVLGAQRALQYGGDQLIKNQMRNFNCSFSYADRPAFFGECFHTLLCGAGVGFSVQREHVAKLPSIIRRTKVPKLHVVEDSIEGWATSVDVLLSSFFEDGGKHPEFRGHRVYFDLSKIRPRGAMISGGFKAPGADPLRMSLDRIEHLLQGVVLIKNKMKLASIQVYDVIMHICDGVLSGGLRRSATICIFSHDDVDMLNAKTGNWFEENPQRGVARTAGQITTALLNRSRDQQQHHDGQADAEQKQPAFDPAKAGQTSIRTADQEPQRGQFHHGQLRPRQQVHQHRQYRNE